MADFFDKLKETLDKEFNESTTENGALGFATTYNPLLDLNFNVASFRKENEYNVEKAFARAYYHDKVLTIKWLFFAGDVRQGLGERRLFRIGLSFLAEAEPDVCARLIPLVAEYTRFDNLLVLLDTKAKQFVVDYIKKELDKDLNNYQQNKPVSLLAKWLPSVNATSVETKRLARILIDGLKVNEEWYRKTLSTLRENLNVVECKMSANEWQKVDYEKVPSKANILYADAFLLHDKKRRKQYLNRLEKGEATVNAGVLFPHDVVHKYSNQQLYYFKTKPFDAFLEQLWKALPDFVNGASDTICVMDGSGSMTRCVGKTSLSFLEIACSLSIYFAEKCTGQFKDKFITFSETPQLIDFSNCETLHDKIGKVTSYTEVANTNIEAVFDLILATAVAQKMKQSDIPKTVLILSDMEFDDCTTNSDGYSVDKKLFEVIASKYNYYGYKLPKLVFWNLGSRTKTIPVKQNDLGVALVSGYSATLCKMVLSNKIDPWEILLEEINSERYLPVENAVAQLK